jgi:hypothetical protein
MSLILDALKKSEKSRHDEANSVLPLIVTPQRGSRRNSKSLPLVPLAIIVIAIAVIAALMLFQGDETPEQTRTVETPRPEVAPPVTAPEPRPEPVAARVQEAPAPEPAPAVAVEEPVVAPPAAPEPVPEPVKVDSRNARQEILQQAGILPAADASSVPPRLSTLGQQLRDSVKPLRLDFHVYSTDRRRRVVFLNGDEYREGDTVRSNLDVVRIIPEGAVMTWKDQRFLLTIED